MHVTTVRIRTGDQAITNATIVAEEMHRWLRENDGFQGLLFLSRQGTSLVLSFWESKELADRHAAVRAQFRERISAVMDVEIEEVSDYAVAFAALEDVRT
ncbi:MAG: hypothetical protein ACJ734_00480 [Gaiellaceae bacterium]